MHGHGHLSSNLAELRLDLAHARREATICREEARRIRGEHRAEVELLRETRARLRRAIAAARQAGLFAGHLA